MGAAALSETVEREPVTSSAVLLDSLVIIRFLAQFSGGTSSHSIRSCGHLQAFCLLQLQRPSPTRSAGAGAISAGRPARPLSPDLSTTATRLCDTLGRPGFPPPGPVRRAAVVQLDTREIRWPKTCGSSQRRELGARAPAADRTPQQTHPPRRVWCSTRRF